MVEAEAYLDNVQSEIAVLEMTPGWTGSKVKYMKPEHRCIVTHKVRPIANTTHLVSILSICSLSKTKKARLKTEMIMLVRRITSMRAIIKCGLRVIIALCANGHTQTIAWRIVIRAEKAQRCRIPRAGTLSFFRGAMMTADNLAMD